MFNKVVKEVIIDVSSKQIKSNTNIAIIKRNCNMHSK